MPIFVPILLGVAALGAAGFGVKKGIDAKDDFDRAKNIGEDAKYRHEKAVKAIEQEREKTNEYFVNLGLLKANIFSDQIARLIQEVKKKKYAKSLLKNFEQEIEGLNLPEMEKMVVASAELSTGVLSSAASGALAGLGAYGTVGALASASTGTAIASLSGVAATNATLAWLGGGSLAAGGLGMAGGTVVLGGVVAGPAIAVLGMVMASQAEKALTQARAYEAEVDEKIETINAMKIVLLGLQANAMEMSENLKKLAGVLDKTLRDLGGEEDKAGFERLLRVGTALKNVLNTPIMTDNGQAVKNLKSKIVLQIKNAGVMSID